MVVAKVNKQEFTYLLSHPGQLSSDQTETVGDIIAEYPYFQPARALYLKGLKAKASFKYNQELRVTAAYTTDRSILFDFITSEAFNQNEISKLIKLNTELLKNIEVKDADDISLDKNVLIEVVSDQHIQESKGIFDPDLFEKKPSEPSDTKQEPSIIDIDFKNIQPSPEEQLGIGKPLEFDKNESRSFSEWLTITSFKPIHRTDQETVTPSALQPENTIKESKPGAPLKKKFDLIDKFIQSNPKIQPVKDYTSTINIDKPKLVQNDSLMTETLARIYLEQKNYDKAIQSYKILILKYPEKSSFFADQIKAVKQLQENNTK